MRTKQALLGGPRLLYRWFRDLRLYIHSGQPVLVVGGGRAGEMLIRDMLRESESAYAPVGIVDDKRSKLGKEIHGVRVIGTCAEIPALVKNYRVESIIIAIPSANAREMQRIVGFCEQSGIPFQTLPAMDALISGATVIEKLREVSIWRAIFGRLAVITCLGPGSWPLPRTAMAASLLCLFRQIRP